MIIDTGDMKQVNTKSGENIFKRDIQIVDESVHSVVVTLWNERAQTFNKSFQNAIFAARGLAVRSFHGIFQYEKFL